MSLLFPLMPKKCYQQPFICRHNDVLMKSESQKWILRILDENRENFKFLPKIRGICNFDGVFGLFRKEMTTKTYTGSLKYLAISWSQEQKLPPPLLQTRVNMGLFFRMKPNFQVHVQHLKILRFSYVKKKTLKMRSLFLPK